jgi:beta-lactamase class A
MPPSSRSAPSPVCSPVLLDEREAQVILSRVDRDEEKLDRFVPYTKADLLEYAPVTKEHLHEGGMTLFALCAAALQYSDNTAANPLLAALGGPAQLTYYARSLGDDITRLDRSSEPLRG